MKNRNSTRENVVRNEGGNRNQRNTMRKQRRTQTRTTNQTKVQLSTNLQAPVEVDSRMNLLVMSELVHERRNKSCFLFLVLVLVVAFWYSNI